MWKTLGSLRETVREGLQEFGRDALRESSLIKSSVVENVAPVAKSLAKAEFLSTVNKRLGVVDTFDSNVQKDAQNAEVVFLFSSKLTLFADTEVTDSE